MAQLRNLLLNSNPSAKQGWGVFLQMENATKATQIVPGAIQSPIPGSSVLLNQQSSWWIDQSLWSHCFSWCFLEAGIRAVSGKWAEFSPCCAELPVTLPILSTKTAGRAAEPFQHHSLLLSQLLCQHNKGCDKTLMSRNPSQSTCMSAKRGECFSGVIQPQRKSIQKQESHYKCRRWHKISSLVKPHLIKSPICRISPFSLFSCLPPGSYTFLPLIRARGGSASHQEPTGVPVLLFEGWCGTEIYRNPRGWNLLTLCIATTREPKLWAKTSAECFEDSGSKSQAQI